MRSDSWVACVGAVSRFYNCLNSKLPIASIFLWGSFWKIPLTSRRSSEDFTGNLYNFLKSFVSESSLSSSNVNVRHLWCLNSHRYCLLSIKFVIIFMSACILSRLRMSRFSSIESEPFYSNLNLRLPLLQRQPFLNRGFKQQKLKFSAIKAQRWIFICR